jgi:hypothetical protein
MFDQQPSSGIPFRDSNWRVFYPQLHSFSTSDLHPIYVGFRFAGQAVWAKVRGWTFFLSLLNKVRDKQVGECRTITHPP